MNKTVKQAAVHASAPVALALSVRALKTALAKLACIVERHNTIPVLSCVHIETKGTETRFTVSDLDMVASITIPSSGQLAEPVCTPLEWLRKLIWVLDGDAIVTLRPVAGEHRMLLDFADGRASLMTLSACEFPMDIVKQREPNPVAIDLPVASLLALLPFSSREESHYYLNGVCLQFTGEGAQAVATDRHKLATLDINDAFTAPTAGHIIPRKAVKIMGVLFGKDASVRALFDGRTAFMADGAVTMITKLIDGSFPDISRVMSDTSKAKARWTVDAKALSGKLARITQVRSADSTVVTIMCLPDGRIAASATQVDFGTINIALPGATDAPFNLQCNSSYLNDVIAFFKSEKITIHVISPGDPIRFEGGGRLAVLMPMRASFPPSIDLPKGAVA